MAPATSTATTTTTNGNAQTNGQNATQDRFIVKYRQNYYDLTEFRKKHPGGVNTLKGLTNTDMTARFMKAPPHSDEAMYLMQEYQIKSIAHNTKAKSHAQTNGNGNSNGNGNGITRAFENGVELLNTEHEDKINNNNELDESMEYLVDWSKAMVPQISHIIKDYNEWVHKPVDRPLRLFGPWYLEMCTKTPWWVIPTFWIPAICACVKNDFLSCWNGEGEQSLLAFSLYFMAGILFWTLLEYSLHRWIFHMKVDANTNAWLCTLHFMIHGLHHKVPFDPLRLVFPPVPGVILTAIIYTPLSVIMPHPRIWLGGALFGYLCYDLIHYYLHYGNPSTPHLYHMKRYHYQHHFAHQDLGYGISSPLWDFVFNTRIHLRKLKFQLRWH